MSTEDILYCNNCAYPGPCNPFDCPLDEKKKIGTNKWEEIIKLFDDKSKENFHLRQLLSEVSEFIVKDWTSDNKEDWLKRFTKYVTSKEMDSIYCPRCKREYRFKEEAENRLCACCVIELFGKEV